MEEGVSLVDVFWDLVQAFSSVGSSWVSPDAALPSVALPASQSGTFPSGIPVYVTDIPGLIARSPWLEPLSSFWNVYVPVALFITLLCGAGIIYSVIRVRQIRRIENAQFAAAANTVRAKDMPKTTLRWNRIMEHMESGSEHNWRLAVLEADIMLNELLDVQGYKGETMADKMKQVARGDFNTIDQAWEAHKYRNRVAHEGSEHPITEREANRIIGLYRNVFKEFKLVE